MSQQPHPNALSQQQFLSLSQDQINDTIDKVKYKLLSDLAITLKVKIFSFIKNNQNHILHSSKQLIAFQNRVHEIHKFYVNFQQVITVNVDNAESLSIQPSTPKGR